MALIMITITCVLVVTISGFPAPETIYENNPSIVPGVFISVETLRELQAKAQQNTDKAKQNQAADEAIEKSSANLQQVIPEKPVPEPAVIESKSAQGLIQAPIQPPVERSQPKQVTLPVLETFYANPQPNQEPLLSRREENSNQAPQNYYYQVSQPNSARPINEKPAPPPPGPQYFNQAPQNIEKPAPPPPAQQYFNQGPPKPAQPEAAAQPIQAVQIQGDQPKPLTNIPTLLTYSPNYSSLGQGRGGQLFAVVPFSGAAASDAYTLLQAQPFRGNIFTLNPQN